MNLFGHNLVAYKVIDRYNPNIAAGSHLPDLVPFLSSSVFSFEEIHESPQILFEYTRNHSGDSVDLALGMMAHSVKFGADKFNHDIEGWLMHGDQQSISEIVEKISDCTNLSIEIARGSRLHNYLWAGLDFYIIENSKGFTQEVKENYQNIKIEEIAKVLSEAYSKDFNMITQNLQDHFGLINKYDISTKYGITLALKDVCAGLPEKDDINVPKAVECTEFIQNKYSSKWAEIVEHVVTDTKSRMSGFLKH